jgi:hypothetical protein
MKMITITGCTDSLLWYADRVGQQVVYLGEEDDIYWSRDSGGYKNIVWKKDATIDPKRYWTIVFPGDCGQHVQETWNEDQIIKSYFTHWVGNMIQSGHGDEVSRERCIDDWIVVHWAQQTDEFGNKL